MKQLDSVVFDAGFNNCDLKSLETILAEDLEFYQQKPNAAKEKTGYAKFTSYWELNNGDWRLKRVFSFDHRAAN